MKYRSYVVKQMYQNPIASSEASRLESSDELSNERPRLRGIETSSRTFCISV